MSFDEIIKLCCDQEQEAVNLYTELRNRATDDAAKLKFQELVDMETQHLVNLQTFEIEKYMDLPPANLKVTDYLTEPSKDRNLTTQEALILAAKREDKTAKLYQDLAHFFKDNVELNTFFQMMADEELRHKHDLETEYEDEFLQEG